MSNNLRFTGMQCMVNMVNEEKEQKNISTYKKLPMKLLPPLMNLAFKKHIKDNPGAQAGIKELLKQVGPDMTKDYFCHMAHLLGDLRNHMGTHQKEDFAFLKGRVLIIEPDDDRTFTEDIKEELIRMMSEPRVVRELPGGHLAMLFDLEGFVKIMNDFMDTQKL